MATQVYKIEFHISDNMVKKFIVLTGDRSSLHTDDKFARRSMYRQSIVHGMLPVLFISVSRFCHANGQAYSFEGISGRFIKPVFIDDRLSLETKISEAGKGGSPLEAEYILKKAGAGTVLATGSFKLRLNAEPKDGFKHQDEGDQDSCMVTNPVAERDLLFENIVKGDEDSFRFMISGTHTHALHEIINEGLLSEKISDRSDRLKKCDAGNLLATSLFSTFVGMCMPGKYATFTDFNVEFHSPVRLNTEYLLKGKVGFKSISAASLLEDICIYDLTNERGTCAMGKINAKVNEVSLNGPSMIFLKDNESDLQLKDKVVLITGGSRGIGETTAKLFAVYGSKVIVNYVRGEEDANRVVDDIRKGGGEAFAVQADVSVREEVTRMVSIVCKKYGTVNVLVNNAVKDAHTIPFLELSWDEIQKDIDVTVRGAFNCCQEILPLMLKNRSGKIINISTISTDNPMPNQSKYVISKSGLVGLTRSLAVEFAPYNIQVNMVVPSIVETDLTKHVPKMFIDGMKNNTPMKRNATPVDVAKAIIFLASSLAQFTTGQKVMVTGGNPSSL